MSRINTSQKYGKWTTIKSVRYRTKSGKFVTKWDCVCECGTQSLIASNDLIVGKSKKCMRCAGKIPKDLSRKRFGNWIVIKKSARKNNKAYWWCECSCKEIVSIEAGSLMNGTSTRCRQCYYKSRGNGPTSKKNRHPLYNIWMSMLSRCCNTKSTHYRFYGNRGIKVCNRWKKLENFYDDMGPRPSNRHTIDRIDNDGDYEPSNCRWATYKEQSNNRSDNRKITYNGITKNLCQWADLLRINRSTLGKYLGRNSFEKSIVHYCKIILR